MFRAIYRDFPTLDKLPADNHDIESDHMISSLPFINYKAFFDNERLLMDEKMITDTTLKSLNKYKGSHLRMKSVTETLVENLRSYFNKGMKKRIFLELRKHAKEEQLGNNAI